ncbi:MAG: dipeptidase, partial [bacterium]
MMNLFLVCLTLFFNGAENSAIPTGYDAKIYTKALNIAKSTIILDGHIDVPYRLLEEFEDITQSIAKGDFDYPRAKQGGLDAPFMSIYIPARFQKTPGVSKKHADKLIAMMDSVIAANPNKFAKALTPQEVRRNFEKGLISLPYGMENGSAIEDDLANIEYFYNKGIRYITLTHSKKNLICDSSYDSDKGWNGLSPFGRKVVEEMNRVGVIVDISHVSDSTFYQVLRYTKVPPICSHSSCRYFTPGWERNVDDNMLKALAKKGGVLQINFGSAFLTHKANQYSDKYWSYRGDFMTKHGITDDNDPRVKTEMKKYKEKNPYPYSTINDVVAHIDHVVKIVGIDHVGLGSDF